MLAHMQTIVWVIAKNVIKIGNDRINGIVMRQRQSHKTAKIHVSTHINTHMCASVLIILNAK